MNVMVTVAMVIASILMSGIRIGLGCTFREPAEGGKLAFVYKVSKYEFTSVGSTKRLNCEAVNFCTVTWYRDGIPYPWKRQDSDVSQHVYMEDNNQLLLFKGADVTDKGEYTCVASNGEESISRKIALLVKEETYNGPPIFLDDRETSCTNQTAKIGQTVSFYCKFYVGNSMDSAIIIVGWMKVVNGVDTPLEVMTDVDYLTKENFSQNNSVIGARLYVVDIKENAFGTWKVYAHNGYKTEVALSVGKPQQDGEQVETAENSSGEYIGSITLLTVLFAVASSLLVLVTLYLFIFTLRNRRLGRTEIPPGKNLNQIKTTETEES